jgi:hypothetical protein
MNKRGFVYCSLICFIASVLILVGWIFESIPMMDLGAHTHNPEITKVISRLVDEGRIAISVDENSDTVVRTISTDLARTTGQSQMFYHYLAGVSYLLAIVLLGLLGGVAWVFRSRNDEIIANYQRLLEDAESKCKN